MTRNWKRSGAIVAKCRFYRARSIEEELQKLRKFNASEGGGADVTIQNNGLM
ncbi:hypothetical protein [Aquimixticola soesokkakensis]|uniref:hypothetical protein n=1 Tax=Aquimixticola soesokkakensis TaxID=1519096 RepID=UPI0013562B9C|nr:hypothetical protein [Aquimixticola soesokkakensis]